MSINDNPIAKTADGRVLYDNACTVVCVLVRVDGGLLAVRRNNEPGRGFIGLPGGYQMRGETWQEAGAREALEETGYSINPHDLNLVSMVTDEYQNNLIIAESKYWLSVLSNHTLPAEVQEVLRLPDALECTEWAFPRHHSAAVEFFRRELLRVLR